ncbi:MAG: PAS domain-containing protein, partial [Myxococcota bacterium]
MAGRLTDAARQRIRDILADPDSYVSGDPDPDRFDRLGESARILDSLPALIYEYDTAARRTTFLTGNVDAVVGSSADAVLGTSPSMVIDPRDLDDVRRSLASAGPDGRFETAYRVMHRDRGILWSFVVGRIDDGGHRGVVVQSDQFQRLESELEEKSRMLEAVSRSLPGALYQIRLSPDGVMTCPFCAPSIEALLGTSAASIMESPDVLSTYVVEEDRSLLFETAMVSARELTPWELTFRVQRPDGEVKQLWSGGVPEREPDGSTIWTSLCVDITEVARRSHEAEARTRAFYERDKLESLGRLAGGMAHDINNLLVGVLGNAELLRETTLPKHVVELAEEIALAAAGCAQLTRQILAFAGRGRVRDDAVELRQLVEETVRLARPLGDGPAPQLELGPHVLMVRGDPTELRQVVLNLVTNAMQASPEAPVEVRARVV